MATRSTIAIELPNGTVQSIYCHWDGYPSHNGQLLMDHYKTSDKVESLIALGSISLLAPEVSIPEGSTHSFESPESGIVVAYHRDRGESLTVYIHDSAFSFLKSDVEEYGYLFTKDGKWLMVDGHENTHTRDFVELEKILKKV
jgi:hypothetical protein